MLLKTLLCFQAFIAVASLIGAALADHPVAHPAPVHRVAHPAPVHRVAHPAPVHRVAHPAPVHRVAHPAPAYHKPAPVYHKPAPVYHKPAPSYKEPAYDEPAHYQYNYAVADDYYGANFAHSEARDGYATTGEYRVALPDGRTQIVTYQVADGYSGYIADVRYEGEARYDHHAPAYKPAPVAYKPAPVAYKPAPVYHA